MGDLVGKISLVKGEVRTVRKVSHERRRSELSQEKDQAQEQTAGYHRGDVLLIVQPSHEVDCMDGSGTIQMVTRSRRAVR